MKYVRAIGIAVIICLVITMSGCKIKSSYDFENDSSLIDNVEIVSINYEIVDNKENVSETTICEISDIEEFLIEFSKLNCYVYMGDPRGFHNDCIAIKFNYENGDYEITADIGKITYVNGVNNYYQGFRAFEKNEFSTFLRKWISNMEIGDGSSSSKD